MLRPVVPGRTSRGSITRSLCARSTRVGVGKPCLVPRQPHVVRAASQDPSAGSSGSSASRPGVELDDVDRRRLRFGDQPSRRWQREQHTCNHEPGLLQQLQALQTPADAASVLAARWRVWADALSSFLGRKLYDYFNWRQDTSKDLLVVFGVFSSLVLAAGAFRRYAVDDPSQRSEAGLWADVYQVCQWVFGQEFPGPESPLGQQVLAVATAMVGLAAFAMVLALVEQVVLEALEANVKRGSKVFESGHILVLGWCKSQRDMEVVRKVVQQICVAHAPEGGTTVVVLTQRSKLEMEALFWRTLPACRRHGSKLVFRQGSPLVLSDLKLVGACRAAATIIVSDQSRCAAEADAQAVRCAILLDELDTSNRRQGGDGDALQSYMTAMAAAATNDEDELLAGQLDLSLLGRHVVVELKTANALPLLKYACSSRVMALPTSQLNAQRLCRMVKRPVISIVSQQLFNFENGVSIFVHYYPHLVGTHFGQLAFLFSDGIVLGLVDRATGKARMAPNKDCIVQASHALVVCRPTDTSSHAYVPLAAPPSEQELRLQESIAAWASYRGQPAIAAAGGLHQPVAAGTSANTLLAATAAAAAAAAATLQAPAAAAGPPSTAASAGFVGGAGAEYAHVWSSAVSQVELLRHQAEASAGPQPGGTQPGGSEGTASSKSAALGSGNSSSGRAWAHAGMAQNNIVSASHCRSKEASRVTVSSQHVQAAAVMAPQGPDQASASGGGVTVVCDTTTSPAHAGSSGSSSSSSKGAALRTADWPVLSGTHAHQRDAGSRMWQQLSTHLPTVSQAHAQSSSSQQALQQQHHAKPAASERHAAAGGAAAAAAQPGSGAASTGAAAAGAGAGLGALLGPRARLASSLQVPGVLNDAAVLVPPEYLEVDECAEKVVVLGWGPNSLMVDLIRELDHGLSALPQGSEVVFVNMHSPHDSLGQVLTLVSLENIQVRQVTANPLQRSSLGAALDVAAFRCALVLCDELWVDPDANDSNGLDSLDEPSVLRLDSLVMVAQLNMRKLLEDSKLPAINIICQKVASEGLTRFEDRHRLPLGISVNLNSFAAKMLAQVAANPLMLAPVTRLGEDAVLTIVDSSCYAAPGETLNFWQLMVRCQLVGDVLVGFYEVPEHLDQPLNTVVDPIGLEARGQARVWNVGDGRLKFIVLRHKKKHNHGSTSGSHDDMELENTRQAGWVAARERTPLAANPQRSSHSHASSWVNF